MLTLVQDLRFGLRMLSKHPVQTAVAVLALGLGIGLTTAMFSILYAVFLRGLPFEDSDRLMRVGQVNLADQTKRMGSPTHDYLDWRARQTSFVDLAAWYGSSINLSGGEGGAAHLDGAYISTHTFALVGVEPTLGRGFLPEDDRPGAVPVAILSHEIWQQLFGADPDIVGRSLRVNGEEVSVIGVMPAGFRFPLEQDLWLPLRLDPGRFPRGGGVQLQTLGKLKPGVSREAAQAELTLIAGRLAEKYPDTNQDLGVFVTPYVDGYTEEMQPRLHLMMGAVLGVLLIACLNVSNLLLAGAVQRVHEMAVRAALGASRRRVLFQFLVESSLIAGLGCLLGLGLSLAGIKLFLYLMGGELPGFWMEVRLDSAVLLFTAVMTALAALLSGTLPAMHASRIEPVKLLKDQVRGSSPLKIGALSNSLVIGEIALSCGLLIMTGLMIKSMVNVNRTEVGFSPENIFVAQISLPRAQYGDYDDVRRFYEDLLPRLTSIPGASSVAFTSALPIERRIRASEFRIEGMAADGALPSSRWLSVSPGFWQTLGLTVHEGRVFGPRDIKGSPLVAIVSQSFARRYFPQSSPLGRRILFEGEEPENARTIVGVAPDILVGPIEEPDRSAIYLSIAQSPSRSVDIAIRTRSAPLEVAPLVRRELAAVDPDLPLFWEDSMEQRVAYIGHEYRSLGRLLSVFGGVGLFLACLGLYSVLSFNVERRGWELGLRIALGAERRDLVRLVLKRGLLQVCLGLALGLVIALNLSGLVAAFLFQVQPRDFLIFAVTSTVLAATGLLACLLPALKATRVDPLVAFRLD